MSEDIPTVFAEELSEMMIYKAQIKFVVDKLSNKSHQWDGLRLLCGSANHETIQTSMPMTFKHYLARADQRHLKKHVKILRQMMRISVKKMRDDHNKGDLIGITMDKLPKSLKTDFKKIAMSKNYKA